MLADRSFHGLVHDDESLSQWSYNEEDDIDRESISISAVIKRFQTTLKQNKQPVESIPHRLVINTFESTIACRPDYVVAHGAKRSKQRVIQGEKEKANGQRTLFQVLNSGMPSNELLQSIGSKHPSNRVLANVAPLLFLKHEVAGPHYTTEKWYLTEDDTFVPVNAEDLADGFKNVLVAPLRGRKPVGKIPFWWNVPVTHKIERKSIVENPKNLPNINLAFTPGLLFDKDVTDEDLAEYEAVVEEYMEGQYAAILMAAVSKQMGRVVLYPLADMRSVLCTKLVINAVSKAFKKVLSQVPSSLRLVIELLIPNLASDLPEEIVEIVMRAAKGLSKISPTPLEIELQHTRKNEKTKEPLIEIFS